MAISGPGSSPPPGVELLKGALEDKALEDSLAKADQKSKAADNNTKSSPADSNKAIAQKHASAKAAQAQAVKFQDSLQSVDGSALLQSLQSLGQSTGAQNGGAPTADAQHQAATAFSQLEPLMGAPPTGNVKLAEAFSPDAVNMRFQTGFQLGLDTLQGLLSGFGPQIPADPAQQTQLLEELRTSFGLNTTLLAPPSLQTSDMTIKSADIAKFEKLRQIVDTFFEKAVSQTPDEAVAHLPSGLMQALKDNLGEIKPAVTNLFNACDAAAAQAKAGQEIIIPNAAVLAVEKALAPVVQAQVAIIQTLKKSAKDIPAGAVADAASKIENGGDLKSIHPALAAALRFVTPIGNKEEKGEGGKKDEQQTQALAKQTATRFTTLAQRFESEPAANGAARLTSPSSGVSLGGFSEVNIDTADIGCLTYWIMMMCANAATEDLREVMKELKANIDAKKVQREKMQLMKENQARIGTDMRNEYDQLVGEGVIKPSFSYEQYQAWRTVEYCEDGRAQLSTLNYADLPKLATEGPPKDDVLNPEVMGGETPSVPGVVPLPAADAQTYADEYGLHASDIQYMYAHFMSDPKLKGGDFEAYLLAGKGDPSKGAGLKAAGDPPDAAIVAANSKAVETYFNTLAASGVKADAELAKAAEAEKAKAPAVDASQSAVNLKETQQLILKIELLKALKTAGVDVNAQLTSLQGQLSAQLKKPMTAADEAKLNAWKNIAATGSDSLNGQLAALGDHMAKMYTFLNDTARTAITAVGTAMKDDDGDNYTRYDSFGWDATGAYANYTYFEYDDANSSGTATWRKDSGATIEYDGSDHEHATASATWPDAGTAQPLVDLMNAALSTSGKSIPGGNMTALANALKAPLTSGTSGNYSYAGPKEAPAGTPAKPLPTTSTATGLATGWKAQHQADVLHDKAEAKRKAQAEKKAADLTTKNQATADSMAGASKNMHVDLDENGMDASGNAWRMGSVSEYGAAIENEKGKLDSLSDLSEPMSMRLQQYMDRRAKALEALSNLMKKMSQTAETIVANMK